MPVFLRPGGSGRDAEAAQLGPLAQAPLENAQGTLQEAVCGVLGDSAPVTLRVVRGHPAPVLVDASAHAQLLVIGSRGHGAFAGMLLGSVSQHCVHQASCPVVVIRTPHGEPRPRS